EQGLARLFQRLFVLLALGDVTRDFGKTAQAAVRRMDQIDNYMRPKAAAVLAHAPAFHLAAARRQRFRQRFLRHAGGAVLRRVEAGEMLTDDFLGVIALDARRAGIPVGDDTLWAQHIEGIVGDALHQKAELLLAGAQVVFRLLALRE